MSTPTYSNKASYLAALGKLQSFVPTAEETGTAFPDFTWVWVDNADYRKFFSSLGEYPSAHKGAKRIRLKEALAFFEHGESWLEILRP